MSDTRGVEVPNRAPSRGILRATSTWLPRPGTGSARSSACENDRYQTTGTLRTLSAFREPRSTSDGSFGSLAAPSLLFPDENIPNLWLGQS
jgi:hypothetical protein